MTRKLLLGIAMLFLASSAIAAIKTQAVEYSSNGTVMEGYLAYDDSSLAPRPGILIVHDWMGLGPFSQEKALRLAKQGYIAFAVDIYGKGVRPKNSQEAGGLATQYKQDRKLLRARIRAAFDKLASLKQTDPKKIVAMGYCFGGTTALELARSGAPLAGTVSFHGGLASPTPEDAKNIKGPVLALHGADDPFVPPAEVRAFQEEMKKGRVRLRFISYPGAVHSFTNPDAGSDKSKGTAYNTQADQKSWDEFERFLKEIF